MDTQGLFEIGSIAEENSRIFGLSTLISSIQIVNVKDVMKENDIEYLEMATSLTKFITQKKNSRKSIWKPFQKLLFLIRDWADEEAGFGYENGEKYLNTFLSMEDNPNTKTQTIRKNIHGSFDKIECFLLNHPGTRVNKKNFHGEWIKLEEEFVDNLKIFIESILGAKTLVKKSILGKEITGLDLKNFIYEYLNAFRDTKLPEIENILQMTIDNQMKTFVAEQVKIYQAEMNENVDFNRPDFPQFVELKHENLKIDSIQKFIEKSNISDEMSIKKFSKILEIEIDQVFKSWHETTMREFQRFIDFKKEMQKLNLENEEYKKSVEELREETQRQAQESAKAKHEYDERIKLQQELTQKLNTQVSKMNFTVIEKEEEIRKIQEDLDRRTKEYEQKFKEQQEDQKRHFEKLEAQWQNFQLASIQRDKDVESCKKQLAESINEFYEENKKQEEKLNHLREGFTDTINDANKLNEETKARKTCKKLFKLWLPRLDKLIQPLPRTFINIINLLNY